MNLLVLLAGLLPWPATSVSAFTRVYLACSVLSLEVQAVTWLGRGTLTELVPLNVALALGVSAWHLWRKHRPWEWVEATRRRLPLVALAVLLLLVAGLNLWRPLEAADPYMLDRVHHIERTGGLTYAASLEPKANIVGGVYELLLADLGTVPTIGPWLVRLHGVAGLALLALAVAAAQEWLPIGQVHLARALPFVVPVVFNELVVLKNDLFVGASALVALAWTVSLAGSGTATRVRDVAWAGWLAGLVGATKLTNLAVALIVTLTVALRTRRWPLMATSAVAAGIGAVAGGLALVLWQNTVTYGDPLAAAQVEAMGNVNRSLGAVVMGASRFLVSLFDLGLVTRQVWPGRGGWGGTFGLPLVWALIVLCGSWRANGVARHTLLAGVAGLVALGVTFPDADLAHRLALGPGLLLIVSAASVSRDWSTPWVGRSLRVVLGLTAFQIARSAWLYVLRAP